MGIRPVYKLVDTCAAEFEAATPYYYSTYEKAFCIAGCATDYSVIHRAVESLKTLRSVLAKAGVQDNSRSEKVQPPENWHSPTTSDDEIRVSQKKKVIILAAGPNRIGQGIEFDYCCGRRRLRRRNSALNRSW